MCGGIIEIEHHIILDSCNLLAIGSAGNPEPKQSKELGPAIELHITYQNEEGVLVLHIPIVALGFWA